jgi:hypothetical protein
MFFLRDTIMNVCRWNTLFGLAPVVGASVARDAKSALCQVTIFQLPLARRKFRFPAQQNERSMFSIGTLSCLRALGRPAGHDITGRRNVRGTLFIIKGHLVSFVLEMVF